MTEILTDRTTRYELEAGETIEVRMIEHEIPEVWQVKMETYIAGREGVHAYVEIRLVVVR